MKDLANELVVSEMTKIALTQYGTELEDVPPDVRDAIEEEAIAIVEDLLEMEYERDLESRLAGQRSPDLDCPGYSHAAGYPD